MATIGLQIVLILVLIGIESYFAASEIALISARRALLRQRAEEGAKGAVTAMKLMDDPTRLLSTIQIGITVIGFLAASAGAVSLAQPVARWLTSLGFPMAARIAPGLAVVLVTLIISYVTLVLGELVPKRLGLQRAEAVAVAVAEAVLWLERAAAPLVWLLTVSTNGVSRLIGVKGTGARPGVSEEEIKLLVTEQGTLLDEEKRMIHEIFELGDTVAREIMVPRVDMMLAEDTSTVTRTAEILQGTGFSRVPVFHENHDTIVGIALLKDLVGPLARGAGEEPITKHMREPVFVPETKGILGLLSEMRALHNQIAIVVDEYGGTAGLVTMEDIVEEIVGEIADEFDREHRFIQRVSAREWAIDGRLAIEEAMERGMPVEESDEYETVAGWMLAQLGHIPTPGESTTRRGWEFRVQAMRRRRIMRIRVTGPEPEAPAEHEGARETRDENDTGEQL
jgi:putative hemolysin